MNTKSKKKVPMLVAPDSLEQQPNGLDSMSQMADTLQNQPMVIRY
jgi:hypothetical protein